MSGTIDKARKTLMVEIGTSFGKDGNCMPKAEE